MLKSSILINSFLIKSMSGEVCFCSHGHQIVFILEALRGCSAKILWSSTVKKKKNTVLYHSWGQELDKGEAKTLTLVGYPNLLFSLNAEGYSSIGRLLLN